MPSMESTVNLPISRVMKDVTVVVRVTGMTQWHARVWLGEQLLKLAATVMGCAVKVEFGN